MDIDVRQHYPSIFQKIRNVENNGNKLNWMIKDRPYCIRRIKAGLALHGLVWFVWYGAVLCGMERYCVVWCGVCGVMSRGSDIPCWIGHGRADPCLTSLLIISSSTLVSFLSYLSSSHLFQHIGLFLVLPLFLSSLPAHRSLPCLISLLIISSSTWVSSYLQCPSLKMLLLFIIQLDSATCSTSLRILANNTTLYLYLHLNLYHPPYSLLC